MKDQRRFSRAPYGSEIVCNNMKTRAKDLGLDGVCVLSNQLLDIEHGYVLKLGFFSQKLIQIQAFVKWQGKVKFDLFEYGFQFKGLTLEDQWLLQDYVSGWHQKEIERRKLSRYSISVQVMGSLSCQAELKNINSRGFCLILPESLELGKILFFVLVFPDKSEIRIYGQVIWCEEILKSVYKTGVSFWYIDAENENKINEQIAKVPTKVISL
ncbi:MAG: PilZ domain-containing protein [Spirochaetales bacterium]|nr:PilZ domain-containing protein [Spirochaetales bacterium]